QAEPERLPTAERQTCDCTMVAITVYAVVCLHERDEILDQIAAEAVALALHRIRTLGERRGRCVRVAVRHHHDERFEFPVSNQVVENQVRASVLGPTTLVA